MKTRAPRTTDIHVLCEVIMYGAKSDATLWHNFQWVASAHAAAAAAASVDVRPDDLGFPNP